MSVSDNSSQIELELLVDELGGLEEVFRPHPASIVAPLIIGTFCVALGPVMGLYFSILRELDEAAVVLLGCSVLFLCSGTATLIHGLRRRTYQVLFCKHGLIRTFLGRKVAAKWSEIDRVDVRTQQKSRLGGQQVLGYQVILVSGACIELQQDSVAELDRLLRRIETEISLPQQSDAKRKNPTNEAEQRLNAEEAIVELGGKLDEFRPSATKARRAIVGGTIMVLVGALGLALLIWTMDGQLGHRILATVLVGFAFVLCAGLGLLVRSWRRLSYRLIVCKHGVVEVDRASVQRFRWDDIIRVELHDSRHLVGSKLMLRMKSGHELNLAGLGAEDVQVVQNSVFCKETMNRAIPWHRTVEG